MTTFTNALRYFPATVRGHHARPFAGNWAPSAATEFKLVFGGVIASLVGASYIVLHALSQAVAFH